MLLLGIVRGVVFVVWFPLMVLSFVITSVLVLPLWLMPISEKRQEQVSGVVQRVALVALVALVVLVGLELVSQGGLTDLMKRLSLCVITQDGTWESRLDALRRFVHWSLSGGECLS